MNVPIMPSRRTAFSLLEVAVVIVILMLLAAFLLPVTRTTRGGGTPLTVQEQSQADHAGVAQLSRRV